MLCLFGIGLLVALAGSYSFYLSAYGKGGVPEHRGEFPNSDRYFPEGVDYILFNHGDVTVISPDYYRLAQWAGRLSNVAFLAALPLLLLGIPPTWQMNQLGRRGWYVAGNLLCLMLFVPHRYEPYITQFGKVAFLLVFAGLLVFGFTGLSVCEEGEFLRRVHLTYGAIAVISLLGAWALGQLRRDRMGAEETELEGGTGPT